MRYTGDSLRELTHAVAMVCDRINGTWLGQDPPIRHTQRFLGPSHAIRWFLVYAVDGPPTVSMGDPDRLAHLSSRGTPGAPADSRAIQAADDAVTVEACLRTAVRETLRFVPYIGETGALFALLARGAAGATPSDIADRLADQDNPALVTDLARGTHKGWAILTTELAASGLIERYRRSMDDRVTDNDLIGWKEIAGYLRIAVRTAMDWAEKYDLPVYELRLGGTTSRMEAKKSELRAWHLAHLRGRAPQCAETQTSAG